MRIESFTLTIANGRAAQISIDGAEPRTVSMIEIETDPPIPFERYICGDYDRASVTVNIRAHFEQGGAIKITQLADSCEAEFEEVF